MHERLQKGSISALLVRSEMSHRVIGILQT